MKKIIGFLVIASSFMACKVNKPFNAPQMEQAVVAHKKVAILPFKVTFSEDYKKISREGKISWEEQERRAGIDLQKSTFEYFAKRANKKGLNVIPADFLSINKKLQEAGIPFSQLMTLDKGRLGDILGVDAIIFGAAEVDFNMRNAYMGNNGILASLELYDGVTGALIWKDTSKDYIRGRFDSPQDLASRAVNDLMNSLPYKRTK